MLSDKNTLSSLARSNALHFGHDQPSDTLAERLAQEVASLRNQLHASQADNAQLEVMPPLAQPGGPVRGRNPALSTMLSDRYP